MRWWQVWREMVYVIVLICFLLTGAGAAGDETVNPVPRAWLADETLQTWRFDQDRAGWGNPNLATLAVRDGVLRIESSGDDPFFSSPILDIEGPIKMHVRMRSETAGSGQVFWTTSEEPEWSADRTNYFRLRHDGQWRDYNVRIDEPGTIQQVRFDPGSAPGRIEIHSIRIESGRPHPLELKRIRTQADRVVLEMLNHGSEVVRGQVNDEDFRVAAESAEEVVLDMPGDEPFAMVPIELRPHGLPALRRTVAVHRPDASVDWVTRSAGGLSLDVAPDGSGGWLRLDGERVAVLSPLLHLDGEVPELAVSEMSASGVRFEGEGVTIALELEAEALSVRIEGDDDQQAWEGPVVRVLGTLEQGVFAGLEYLGQGEWSSSRLDIRTDDHLRYEPDRWSVTMPLMAVVTDRVSAALTWEDMSLQPIYAAPNFLDGADDHRMALRGSRMEATLRLHAPEPVEEAIAWVVNRQGLPPLPDRPRDDTAQRELVLKSLHEVLADEDGWGHAAEARWSRHPYADIVSTFHHMGEPVDPSRLVSGGSHVRNDAAYLLTDRAEQWINERRNEAQSLLAEQQEDGSFHYDGPYMGGHFEDTASGYVAWRALLLLDYARLTGDEDALAGGLDALAFMKRFRTPRGAQTHELSLHTPDLLASAYLVWAYVYGYELTGEQAYLDEARRWALSGLPFIYLWSEQPIMLYATIAVFGATDWVEPNWIGLPVQWCGGVYAYALALLAPYDRTLDWEHLARGILITAEQMQYPEGELAGTLPDFFLLREQRRAGPSINPAAVVSLQRVLDGEPEHLFAAREAGRVVASPYPVTISDGVAIIQAERGQRYQVVIDGQDLVEVDSDGEDRIHLDEARSTRENR